MMKEAPSSARTASDLQTSNEFLNREIERLEADRDALRNELHQIHTSYAWKVISAYRRWLALHRHQKIFRWYEKSALWILDRILAKEHLDNAKRYRLWLRAHELTEQHLASIAAAAASFPYRPLIEIALSVSGAANERLLASTLDSIRAQVYDNWHLGIACDGSSNPAIDAILARYPHDARIEVTNESVDSVKGEFIVFLDQHSQLARDALYEVVKRLNRNPLTDLFYWDEDRIDSQGRRNEPFFKPDWNPDLLLSMNYFGECFLIRRALVDELEDMRREFEPAQNYDLALRATERTARIVHIPEVLYHRHTESALPAAQLDGARTERSARALEAALHRRGQPGVVATIAPGLYAVRYEIRGDPLVSILIPTRDRCEMLRQCLDSIYRATDYRKYEIIILDNDSREPATLAYFEELAGKVQVVRCPGPFNFSAMNNLGASKANGDYLLFLNNDTQVIRAEWLRAMLEQAQRPEVGAVGAKLLFPDERIQHAGVVLGMAGLVGHAFEYEAGNQLHYFGFSDAIRDCSAVTAACMMMRRAVFDEVGRFDEALAVEFNDIDLCLRLRERGYLVVYTPLALLHHYESVSRHHFPHPKDHQLFVKRWEHCLRNGDPYYNRNLTLAGWDFSIGM